MKLPIDLIPLTAWGENLRTKLGRYRWNKFRAQVMAEQGEICAVCGATGKLQCHEKWEFCDESGEQTLCGFQIICNLCHLASHIGLAQQLAAQGHLDLTAVTEHSLRVNGISQRQFEAHKKEALEQWKARSARTWKLDLGEWSHLVEGE